MRDVLFVVAIVGMFGIWFVLALAAVKYHEVSEKERKARAEAGDPGERDATERSTRPARSGWQREVGPRSGWLAIALILLAAMVIGQVVTNALDVSGVTQILISAAATFALCWVLVGALLLRLKFPTRK